MCCYKQYECSGYFHDLEMCWELLIIPIFIYNNTLYIQCIHIVDVQLERLDVTVSCLSFERLSEMFGMVKSTVFKISQYDLTFTLNCTGWRLDTQPSSPSKCGLSCVFWVHPHLVWCDQIIQD